MVMAISIFVGGENFEELRNSGCYYVDKTELLYELRQDSKNIVTLFTRPRRFGKTLTMRMMESFFDIRRDSRAVFDGLAIMKHEAFCAEWMNQYPVLFITLKDAEGLNFQGAYGMLKGIISDLCVKHSYLGTSEKVDPDDAERFKRLKSKTASDDEIKGSMLLLSRMMAAHYGKPVILLIDEYDVPLAKANEEKEAGERYYGQMLDVIRGIMGTALKSNDYLKFAVVTGCLRIAKESIFTGVNNFASYSVLDDKFSRYFGFTQPEVDELLKTADLVEKRDTFREWYNGYVFGNEFVYCPWDVVNYTSELLYKRTARPKNYWANTSGNGIIRDFAGHDDFDVTDKFETLMNGGTIVQAISDDLTYDSLHEIEDNLWSVLLMTGYLTKANPEEEGNTVSLRIPNAEITGIFETAVVRLFQERLDRSRQRELMDAFWRGDTDTATELMSDFLFDTISFHDYHEDYYHAFITGIFVGLGYGVKSNHEQGLGRTDITLTDKRNRRALVIEAKKSYSEEQMDKDCDDALDQIAEKKYAEGLKGYRQVECYGISFFQKSALVKKLLNRELNL
jgi:hypothetical protein